MRVVNFFAVKSVGGWGVDSMEVNEGLSSFSVRGYPIDLEILSIALKALSLHLHLLLHGLS